MADLKPISQFATASSVEADTLLFVSTPNQNNGYDSEKVSASELGEALVNDFEYTQDLSTVSKTVTGAINENKSVIGYSYDEYDPTTAYSTGDLCIYNNTLYKALQATTGNLPTNTTYWEPTSIADEIDKLKSEISDIQILSETFTSSFSANTINLIEKQFTIPIGYKILTAYDDSYISDIIASPIRFNQSNGYVAMNYFSLAGHTSRTWTIKAVIAKNVN